MDKKEFKIFKLFPSEGKLYIVGKFIVDYEKKSLSFETKDEILIAKIDEAMEKLGGEGTLDALVVEIATDREYAVEGFTHGFYPKKDKQ